MDATLDRCTWVLVADGTQARCYLRDPDNGALRELARFAHPEGRQQAGALARDRAGHGQHPGGGIAFTPRTDPRRALRRRFAHELAHHLESAALQGRYPRLDLFADAGFLGELRGQLGPAARRRLGRGHAVALDLADGALSELEQRVSAALARDEAGRAMA